MAKIQFRDFLAVPFWALALLFDWLAVTIGGVWTAEMFVEQHAQPTEQKGIE